MKKKRFAQSAFLRLRVLLGLLLFAAVADSVLSGRLLGFVHSEAPAKVSQRTLTFAERVAYQRAIEDVYWRHRIWPKESPDPKPSLYAVMSQAQLEKKVTDYLRKSQALEDYWQRPITAEQLQAEMDRMAQHTKQPEVLRELFESQALQDYWQQPITSEQLQAEMNRMAKNSKQPEVLREVFQALGDNPFVVAECLARPALAHRLVTELDNEDRLQLTTIAWLRDPLRSGITTAEREPPQKVAAIDSIAKAVQVSRPYQLPAIVKRSGACTDDTWTPTSVTDVPAGRTYHTAVWTGSEMIVWGGIDLAGYFNTGGRYNPSTDSWTATTTANAPDAREIHTAVWTGTEMIVWGGYNGTDLNSGGRYNPSTDSWTATTTANAPDARDSHTAIWTGSEMIVWGGIQQRQLFNSGGRYNPSYRQLDSYQHD